MTILATSISTCRIIPGARCRTYPSTVGHVLSCIKDGKFAAEVAAVRRLVSYGEKDAAKDAKLSLPAALFCGTFSPFADKASLQAYSQILCGDYDHVEDYEGSCEAIREIPGWFATFRSPSGDGIKALFATSGGHEQHFGSWKALEKHSQEHGLTLDPQTKNINRLTYASHDPNLEAVCEPSGRLTPLDVRQELVIAEPVEVTPRLNDALAALSRVGPAIEGHGGDAKTYIAAAIGRDYGIEPDVWLNCLRVWNQDCVPSWSDSDLRFKIANAYRYANRPAGWASHAASIIEAL